MRNRVPEGPVFDLLSYGRRGSGLRDRLSPAQIQQIARTVARTPEVMVKVLPAGANSLAAVRQHLAYVGRQGDVDLQTDDGQRLQDREAAADLIDDWDLDLAACQSGLGGLQGRLAPRLVHKLVFSMPAGTPADKVLRATQGFCREKFALKHRYVLALHTDEPHPHVHVIIKAISEQGERLNIRKAKSSPASCASSVFPPMRRHDSIGAKRGRGNPTASSVRPGAGHPRTSANESTLRQRSCAEQTEPLSQRSSSCNRLGGKWSADGTSSVKR